MAGKYKVAVIVGSLRKGAFSRMTAKALISVAPDSLDLEIVEIGDMSLFNQDLEADPPVAWTAFRQSIKKADAFLFVTPEYNRSMPAAIKNAIDIGSRPHGENLWDAKPGAVVSTSPSKMGGFGAHQQLRQALVGVNVWAMVAPEAYVSEVAKLYDESGTLINDGTKTFFTTFMAKFAEWIEKHAS